MGSSSGNTVHHQVSLRASSVHAALAAAMVIGLGTLGASATAANDRGAAGMPLGGETSYFGYSDREHGEELWRSDGTAKGTFLVKDIWQGPQDSNPVELTQIGATLYFVAEDPERAWELWRSDGTAEGTTAVVNTEAGLRGRPIELIPFGDGTAFTVWDGKEGWALWRSDGSAEGTRPLANVRAWGLIDLDDTLLFGAEDGRHGAELWRSDGTAAGTALLKDIRPGRVGSDVGGIWPPRADRTGEYALLLRGRREARAGALAQRRHSRWHEPRQGHRPWTRRDLNPQDLSVLDRCPVLRSRRWGAWSGAMGQRRHSRRDHTGAGHLARGA